jgi:protein O-GlcNAc transferase
MTPPADDLIAAGMALHQQGRLADAEKVYRHVLSLYPAHPHALHMLGILAQTVGRHEMAVPFFRRAIDSDASVAVFHYNLGNSLLHLARLAEAATAFADATARSPELFEAHHNRANALMLDGRPGEAIAAYEVALRIRGDDAAAHNNFGMALRDHARLDEAIDHFRQAVRLNPTYAHAYSNLLYALHFHPAYDAAAILREHQQWGEQLAEPLARGAAMQQHANDRTPDRCLRIGYVSPDFRDHPVGRAMLPLLEHHDAASFEVFCYADTARDDPIARRLKAHGGVWHVTSRLSDQQLADRIHADRIDILIDVALHMHHNRLLVFARKPAPVQVSFIGYPATTGLRQIDFRISDNHLDPPGEADQFSAERIMRMPHSFWCYIGDDEPAVNALPARANSHVTFGSLNNPVKMNGAVVELWSRVLAATPNSRLMLFSAEKSPEDHALVAAFASQGVTRDRITLVPRLPREQYLRRYHHIDIALDPFPYNGHMTSCDALWMGVPVVSLRGQTSVGRGGVSLLGNLGMTELLAEEKDQYVAIATSLAHDAPRLASLRATLRQRMANSPLCDAGLFTRGVESLYREMWRRWCPGVA